MSARIITYTIRATGRPETRRMLVEPASADILESACRAYGVEVIDIKDEPLIDHRDVALRVLEFSEEDAS